MRTPGRPGAAATVLLMAIALSGCARTTETEYNAGLAAFDALADEAKAYACADDWYAVQYGVQGFVIVERCGKNSGQSATSSKPLSSAFEQEQEAYTRAYYADNPPFSGHLRKVDAEVLCEQSEQEIRDGIAAWREQTQFPTWDGVEYVPSTDHEVAKLMIWRATACPLLEQ